MSVDRLPLALLATSLLAMNAQAQPSGGADRILPFDAAERTLPNGLKVIVVPTGFPNIVSLQIPVQTGSRNEVEPGKSGFAHFFEHMMFRGTRAYPREAYQAILTKAGARQNAYTTDDYTNYHTTFAKEDLETILKMEADRFQNLEYPVEAFKTESRAVLGEYNKNSANPIQKLFEVQRESAFKVHTYRHTTMGFLKDIEDMPNQFEYSRQFFDRWYRPEHTTVIVAGDVTAAIRRHLSGQDLQVVAVTKDAKVLAEQLENDVAPPIKYEAPKPPEVQEEDNAIAAVTLGIRPEAATITPVDAVFAR